MNDNFFNDLCTEDDDGIDDLTDFLQCQCLGHEYFGMPDVQFRTDLNNQPTGLQYELTPADFELFPKVDQNYRTTFCNLGFWTLPE